MWLDEIEEENKEFREFMQTLEHAEWHEDSKGRMARVLRELVKEIQYWRTYSNYQVEGTTGFRSVYCTTVISERPNLSDDAKELLEAG